MDNDTASESTKGRRALFVAGVTLLLLAGMVALSPRCGGTRSAKVPVLDPFRGVGDKLSSATGVSSGGFVLNGCLYTSKTGDQVRGLLPSVGPAPVITRGNKDLKRVALTLDDGWNADMRILQLLKDSNIKFTAFLIGGRGVAESNPDFVKAIKDAGGEVCSHTYTHYVMRGKDEATVMMEIWKSQGIITGVTHQIYPYIRFSGGAYDQPALDWAEREGFWVVNWTVSNNDTASGVTPDSQVAAVLGGLQPGAIILCHFGGHNTYEVLQRAIPEIQRRGYEVTSLTRVFEGTPYQLTRTAQQETKDKK